MPGESSSIAISSVSVPLPVVPAPKEDGSGLHMAVRGAIRVKDSEISFEAVHVLSWLSSVDFDVEFVLF